MFHIDNGWEKIANGFRKGTWQVYIVPEGINRRKRRYRAGHHGGELRDIRGRVRTFETSCAARRAVDALNK